MTHLFLVEVNENLTTTTYPSIKGNKVIHVKLTLIKIINLSYIVYVK